METNLTFKQQLIFMMADRCVSKYGIYELTDGNIEHIKNIAEKLSEGCATEFNHNINILEEELRDWGIRYSAFAFRGIRTFGDLIQYSPNELLKIHNFGRASLEKVENILEKHNLKLKGQ